MNNQTAFNIIKVVIEMSNIPLKEEKEGGKKGLKELLSSMLKLLGETGKTEASLLHHLAPAGKLQQPEKARRRHGSQKR